ncbi:MULTISPECIES: serine/threonine-protein kinase [Actinomadura]|uniref:Serine/threonine-protein kinase n=1 Tax=Actinomadura yumaensis TaxID=111807 RepID=A0ABW2CTM2_9ACTN|nr:serine/threonine-protein kinase [Actinomadura sp. J1-007]
MTSPLTPADPRRLGGHTVLARLGSGGQGVVYLGRDPSGGRVAIKLLHARTLGDARARARFVRELALLQRVAGFCTARMLDADMAGDQPYIVSEFVPGPSLRELVRAEGPRTGAGLDRLAVGTVTALTAIHRAGVVHRDFKPQNVLMGPDGPRVIDFGIARALDAGSTVTSQVVGTPAYMAPEQVAGSAVGPSADLFAWAATLLFAATGRDPFAGGPLPAVLYRVLHETPDLTPLPPQIADIAESCLAKDPRRRPTAEEALMRLLGGRSPRHPSDLALPRPELPPAPTAGTVPFPADPAEASGGGTVLPAAVPGRADAVWTPTETARTFPSESAPGAAPAPAPAANEARGGNAPGPPAPPVPPAWPEPAGARPDVRRELGRGPAVFAGLVLAGVLAALDVVALAFLIALPRLSEGRRGELLPVVASSFAVLAVVTLVGVVLAWRGSRGAAWTVMAARTVRVAMWGAWSVLVPVQASALVMHAALSGLVVVLLAAGLRAAR